MIDTSEELDMVARWLTERDGGMDYVKITANGDGQFVIFMPIEIWAKLQDTAIVIRHAHIEFVSQEEAFSE